jgi:hypothetical protein
MKEKWVSQQSNNVRVGKIDLFHIHRLSVKLVRPFFKEIKSNFWLFRPEGPARPPLVRCPDHPVSLVQWVHLLEATRVLGSATLRRKPSFSGVCHNQGSFFQLLGGSVKLLVGSFKLLDLTWSTLAGNVFRLIRGFFFFFAPINKHLSSRLIFLKESLVLRIAWKHSQWK